MQMRHLLMFQLKNARWVVGKRCFLCSLVWFWFHELSRNSTINIWGRLLDIESDIHAALSNISLDLTYISCVHGFSLININASMNLWHLQWYLSGETSGTSIPKRLSISACIRLGDVSVDAAMLLKDKVMGFVICYLLFVNRGISVIVTPTAFINVLKWFCVSFWWNQIICDPKPTHILLFKWGIGLNNGIII